MAISGSLINAYYICPRKAWFYGRAMYPRTDFDNLAIGRMITEDSYQRQKKEIEFENLKFDLVKTNDGTLVIGEVKKSSRGLEAARKQVLYYLMFA
ncbi:MAG: Dna2/Cas4 domain-containing protein [Candidatus Omnitrophota bacterium]